jgi:hypothetical protein
MAVKARFSGCPNPLASLKLLLEKDLFILMSCNGLYYLTACCIQASLSSLFIYVYGYQELQAGLIYIPFGVGCIGSTYLWGELPNLKF